MGRPDYPDAVMPWWLTRGVQRGRFIVRRLIWRRGKPKAAFGNERGLCVLLIMICYARARVKVAKIFKKSSLPSFV